MGDEAETVRIGGADAAAGQREIEPEMVREPGEEIGAADIGQEADADLRHGRACSPPLLRNACRRA